MLGTLEYMAPEVLLKKAASHASDVYALGVTINELATGGGRGGRREWGVYRGMGSGRLARDAVCRLVGIDVAAV
jgi:hypothetical protein